MTIEELEQQKALQQLQATKKAIGTLTLEFQAFSEEVFEKLCDLETGLELDKEYLDSLHQRMKSIYSKCIDSM